MTCNLTDPEDPYQQTVFSPLRMSLSNTRRFPLAIIGTIDKKLRRYFYIMFLLRNIAPGCPRGSQGLRGLSFKQFEFSQKAFRRGVVSASRAGGTQSITGRVKHDHRNLVKFYNSIIKSNDPDEQIRYQNQFIWELARHTIGEELVLDPALETYVERGQEITAKDRLQHHKVY